MQYPPRRNCAFVFVCHRGRLEIESLLLAASLRRFVRGDFDLIAAVPTPEEVLGKPQAATFDLLRRLGVRVVPVHNAILEEKPTRDVAYLLTNKVLRYVYRPTPSKSFCSIATRFAGGSFRPAPFYGRL